MALRARAGGRWSRARLVGAVLAVLGAVAACSAAAGVPQRVDQTAPPTTTSRTAPATDAATDGADQGAAAPAAPTQMWVDDTAIDDNAVIVRTGPALTIYDAATLAERWHSDAAVLSADRRTAVAAAGSASGGTTLAVVDVRRGVTRRTIELPRAREVTAVSPTGTLAAVVEPLTLDPVTGMPKGRTRSPVEIIDLVGGTVRSTHQLPGNYVPEAIDGAGVALVEYLPSDKPERYRVRRLDLASGMVGDVYTRDKVALVDEMEGYGRAAVASTNGANLFTLYRDAGRWGEAFVHQLVGGGTVASCIDLPQRGFEDVSALALSPDERTLYVAGAGGAVAVIGANNAQDLLPPAVKTVLYVPGVVSAPSAIAVTTDAIWMVVDGRVVTVERTTGAVLATADAGNAVGVGVSADGRLRFVADATDAVRRF